MVLQSRWILKNSTIWSIWCRYGCGKKATEKLRGVVEVDSTPGQGSVVSIKVPLTLAIIDGMVVIVGPERYIIPTLNVVESLRPLKKLRYSHRRSVVIVLRVWGSSKMWWSSFLISIGSVPLTGLREKRRMR